MRVLFLAFFCFFYSISFCQDFPNKGDSEFGIAIGLYTGQLRDGFETVGRSRSAFGFSLQYEQFLSDKWGIKGRIHYDPKGDSEFDLNYLTIPIMANWHFGKNRRWNMHFGPYFGMLLSANNGSQDVKDLFNSSDLGFDFGIGYKLPIGDQWIFIETDGHTPFSNNLKDPLTTFDFVFGRNALSIGLIF